MSEARVELERILRAQALNRIRFMLMVTMWFLTCSLPEFRSIYESMNVELPLCTRVMMFLSVGFEHAWFVLVPLVWVGWRAYEERVLKRVSVTAVDWVARLMIAGTLMAFYSGCWSPMMKLINNVG